MNDRQIFALFRSLVMPLVRAQPGCDQVAFVRNFQPEQQGTPKGPTVFFVKIMDHNHGSPQRRDRLGVAGEIFDQTQAQLVESTFQFMALVPQRPSENDLTESDVLNIVCGIIQSDAVIGGLRAAGVGVQRVVEVRNPYIVDDHDRFEATPSFDIVLTHYRNITTTTPAAVAYEANVSRV